MEFDGVFVQLAIWLPLVMLWGFSLLDLFHSHHTGIAKALWAIAIVLLPVLGMVLYFGTRPVRMNQYIATAPYKPQDHAETIARLEDLNRRGLLDDADLAKYRTAVIR